MVHQVNIKANFSVTGTSVYEGPHWGCYQIADWGGGREVYLGKILGCQMGGGILGKIFHCLQDENGPILSEHKIQLGLKQVLSLVLSILL